MDDRLKVLKMLEEGKIKAEEAERLLRAMEGEKRFVAREKAETIELHLKGCNVRILQEGDKIQADYDGNFNIERGKRTVIHFTGEGSITIPEDSFAAVHLTAGNLQMKVKSDFSLSNRIGNAEIEVERPVNAEMVNLMGNIDITYLCEPEAEFDVENKMGSVDVPEFKKGDKVVKINNKMGSITIERR